MDISATINEHQIEMIFIAIWFMAWGSYMLLKLPERKRKGRI